MDKAAGGLGTLAGQLGHAAASYAKPLVTKAVTPMATGLRSATTVVPGLAAQAGRTAVSALGQGGQMTASALGSAAKRMAGLPASQPFAPTVGQGLRNAASFAFNPNYPGLDRAPGVAEAVAAARPLDRARQLAATSLRWGSRAATVSGGAMVADGALRDYPNYYGREIGARTGIDESQIPVVQNAIRSNAPGLLWEVAKQQTGYGDSSPFSRMHGQALGELMPAQIRYDMARSREHNPSLFGALDALRSVTPAGALTTLAVRNSGSDRPPDYVGAWQRAAERYGPAALADREGTLNSPFARAYGSVADSVRTGWQRRQNPSSWSAAAILGNNGLMSREQAYDVWRRNGGWPTLAGNLAYEYREPLKTQAEWWAARRAAEAVMRGGNQR